MNLTITTKSPKETQAIAASLAKKLKGGHIIGLTGDLGSGKTTFIQGLAKALGIRKKVTSPTFIIMQLYPIKKRGLSQLCHIDAYRLSLSRELEETGAFEYIGQPQTLTVIEWASRVKRALPKDAIIINFKLGKTEKERILTIKA